MRAKQSIPRPQVICTHSTHFTYNGEVKYTYYSLCFINAMKGNKKTFCEMAKPTKKEALAPHLAPWLA